jgi:hypothetical protein
VRIFIREPEHPDTASDPARLEGQILMPISVIAISHLTSGVSIRSVPERGSASQASKPPKPPVVSASQASVVGRFGAASCRGSTN